MRDFVDGSAFNFEQGQRARKLFAAVVLAALDDAIADDKKYGNGAEQIARWARSRDGREVLSCAGIDPNERVVKGLMEFVAKGVRTSDALSREESERRHAAEEADAHGLAGRRRTAGDADHRSPVGKSAGPADRESADAQQRGVAGRQPQPAGSSIRAGASSSTAAEAALRSMK